MLNFIGKFYVKFCGVYTKFGTGSGLNALKNYDYFSNLHLNFNEQKLEWPGGEIIECKAITTKSEICSYSGFISKIPRKLTTKDFKEFCDNFVILAKDVLSKCEVYYYGDYLEGTADEYSFVNFLVIVKRTFEHDFIHSRLGLFLADIVEKCTGIHCIVRVLESDFEKNPKYKEEIEKLKTAKMIV